MGRALLCIGRRAGKPYYFEKSCQNLYSIEELCYVLGESAYLLDEEILDKKLVRWIEQECGLSELAGNLQMLVNQRATPAAFVGTILDYTGYYPKERKEQVESILKQGRNLSLYERKKAKADSFVKRQKYARAITEYDSLLKELPCLEKELLAKVHHNKGVAQSNLFAYEYAAEEFLKAYELLGNEEEYQAYLTAKRIALKEEEYIRYVAEHGEAYHCSLSVESRLLKIMKEWEKSEKAERMEALRNQKEYGNKNLYYKEVEQEINGLKQEYRDCITN